MAETIEQLRQLREQLTQEMETNQQHLLTAKNKLTKAQAKANALRVYADHEWYAKTMAEVRKRGLVHQDLCKKVAEVKRKIWAYDDNNRNNSFIRAARDILPNDVFDNIMREAVKRSNETTPPRILPVK